MKQYFISHPQAVLVYGDEDVKAEGKRKSPWFKPDWSPDTLRAWFYLGHTAFVRKDWLLTQVEQLEELQEELLTKERSKELSKVISSLSEEERQLLVCRLCELAGGFEKKSNRIGHIPQILFHSQVHRGAKTLPGCADCRIRKAMGGVRILKRGS